MFSSHLLQKCINVIIITLHVGIRLFFDVHKYEYCTILLLYCCIMTNALHTYVDCD